MIRIVKEHPWFRVLYKESPSIPGQRNHAILSCMVVSIKSLLSGTYNDSPTQEHAKAVHFFDKTGIFSVDGVVPGYFSAVNPFAEEFYGDEEQEQLEHS